MTHKPEFSITSLKRCKMLRMIAVNTIGLACTFYCVEEYLTSCQEKLDLLEFLEENEPLGLEAKLHKFGKVMQRTILLLSRAFKE